MELPIKVWEQDREPSFPLAYLALSRLSTISEEILSSVVDGKKEGKTEFNTGALIVCLNFFFPEGGGVLGEECIFPERVPLTHPSRELFISWCETFVALRRCDPVSPLPNRILAEFKEKLRVS